MPIEVEQKFRIVNPGAVVRQLQELGAVDQETVTQVDIYYSHPSRDFAATDEALRIRSVGEANFVTYKGPKLDTETKTRREVEVPLAPGTAAQVRYDELFEALSFRRVAQVTKVRQRFLLERGGQSVELAIDDVQDVGDFVELEIVVEDESEISPAQQIISSLADELQIENTERRSYLELLLDRQH